MSKGTVQITETTKGCGDSGLVHFTAVWPSGKTFSRYVDLSDDVNERLRQAEFAQSKGYEVEINGVKQYNPY